MRIVIIGGGPGGYEAALVAAEAGAEVTVVADEGLGGNSVLWDCVPSKALIVSAAAMGWMQSAHRLGVRLDDGDDIGEGARVDMAAVLDRVRTLAHNQSADIGKKVQACGSRIVDGVGRLAGSHASAPHTVAVTSAAGEVALAADVVLVAPGSKPRVLPFFKPDGQRVFTARELFSLDRLPERLIVVGSGATGAEYAHAFARFGSEVHLVSSRAQILPSEDTDAAAVIEDVFERRGMVIHSQRRAVDLELGGGGSGDGVRVRIGEDEWIEGSHVLFCVGQVPASEGLGLREAGVAVAATGAVAVDGVSRTNVHTIYAAGDVTGQMMLASSAAMQGRTAMWHALGRAVAPLHPDSLSACIFTDPEVATVGMTATEAEARHLPIETVTLRFAGNPRAKMAEATDGFVKLHALRGSGTVVGGTIVAVGASDLITAVTVAVHNRLTVSQLANALTVYPSMSGSIQETARLLMHRVSL